MNHQPKQPDWDDRERCVLSKGHAAPALYAVLAVVESAKKSCVLTVEDHSIVGGLGGAAAEVYSRHFPVGITIMGVADVYGESGEIEQLYGKHCLTADQIAERIRVAVRSK